MLPFYKTNSELMDYYGYAMSSTDTAKQQVVNDDYIKLKEIGNNCSHTMHNETKFHCLGHAFELNVYR